MEEKLLYVDCCIYTKRTKKTQNTSIEFFLNKTVEFLIINNYGEITIY